MKWTQFTFKEIYKKITGLESITIPQKLKVYATIQVNNNTPLQYIEYKLSFMYIFIEYYTFKCTCSYHFLATYQLSFKRMSLFNRDDNEVFEHSIVDILQTSIVLCPYMRDINTLVVF